jgi:hypothetical protein
MPVYCATNKATTREPASRHDRPVTERLRVIDKIVSTC